ncbi:MAG: T9SS type A sorting domain-containing protein [Sphingobacteriaceae bacterium]|nr:T9SS type A sorting domain-containing protein [Sphingobacteriaceae bacterium]
MLGRLTITDKNGDTDLDGDIDTIYSIGVRSFSIWNGVTGQLVYDSGDDLEQITASNSFSVMFNASNGGSPNPKDRSDDKGPEPEGVAIGVIGANTYAFIALERIGGVMVYDVTVPNSPVYVTYVNNRSFATNGPDRGSEGIIFIPQSESPNGQHLVIAANETSSTLSIWGIPGCTSPLSSSLSVLGGTVGCAGTTTLSVPVGTGLNYQWSPNSSTITGATNSTLAVNASGNYMVSITGGTNCSTSSLSQSITVNAAPSLSVVTTNTAICNGQTATLTVSGASAYSWSTSSTTASVAVSPSATSTYSVVGIGTNSCVSMDSISIIVNANPTLSVSPTSSAICSGQSLTLNVSGANTYTWSTSSNSTSITVSPGANTTYSVTGANANNCKSTNTVGVVVNSIPSLTISTSNTLICVGQTVTLNATGATTYTWNTSSTSSSIAVSPSVTTTYSVTGTNANNCSNLMLITQNVSACTDINETSLARAITVYPNPANGYVTIAVKNYAGKLKINITNVLGQSIYSADELMEGDNRIDISEFNEGTYFINVYSDERAKYHPYCSIVIKSGQAWLTCPYFKIQFMKRIDENILSNTLLACLLTLIFLASLSYRNRSSNNKNATDNLVKQKNIT